MIKRILDSRYLSVIFWFTNIILVSAISIYFLIRVKELFLSKNFHGDEIKYFNDLEKAVNQGIVSVILDGTSVPFLILSKIINNFIGNPLFALRLSSFIASLLILFTLILFNKFYLKLNKWIFFSIFLSIIYVFLIQSYWLIGINDNLLAFFGILIFITPYFFNKKLVSYLLVGLFWALAIATRKMALTYFTIYIISFLILAIRDKSCNNFFQLRKLPIILTSFIIFFLSLNIISLKEKGSFSFDDKILKGSINWAQWDYHNAILIDKNQQDRFQHININETADYLKTNGEDSLPSNFVEMVFFDPILTFKEFIIDLSYVLKYLLRETALLIVMFAYFALRRLSLFFNKNKISLDSFIYLFTIAYLVFISFIVITNIQPRWFMFFLPITILIIAKDLTLSFTEKQLRLFFTLNNILLVGMILPHIINNISKISL